MRSNYDKHTMNDIHSQMENSLTFIGLGPKRGSWSQTVMNTHLRIYTRRRCSLLPPNTASWVYDCDRTPLICSLLPPNTASWVCDCDRTSLRYSLLPPNPASWVLRTGWQSFSWGLKVLMPKGWSSVQTAMNIQLRIYTVKWRTHGHSLSWGLKGDHEVKLLWTHN